MTTRYLAALIESVGIDRVVTLETHNHAAFDNAFRIPSIRLNAAEIFSDPLVEKIGDQPIAVMSPDIGGVKRAQLLRERLARRLSSDISFVFMEKRRTAGVISGDAVVGDINGRSVLIYDDLIATGATLLRASRAARSAGAASIYIAAAHAAFLPHTVELFEAKVADVMFVTDSISLRPDFTQWLGNGLHMCSAAPPAADTIRALAHDA